MPTERQIQETVARCVSTMVYYHDRERSRVSDELMSSELRMLAGFVEELGMSCVGTERLIVKPVESELIARYGHELGGRLFREFADRIAARAESDGRA